MSKVGDIYEKLVDLGKRRGFFWPSYEIYGGVAGFIDLGPLGAILKRKIMEKWRKFFILRHQDIIVEIETPVINPSIVFEASGHVEHFTDPIVECTVCGRMFRADHLIEEKAKVKVEGLPPAEMSKIIVENDIKCPICSGKLGDVKLFNLLFKTTIGPYRGNVGYIRPEAAQGMFVSFKRVYETMRSKLPLGIAQIGRVARNEISPRQGMIRLREFTIMEFEFFFNPEKPGCPYVSEVADKKIRILTGEEKIKGGKPIEFTIQEALQEGVIVNEWLAYFMSLATELVSELGIPLEKQYFDEKLPHERAHYATQTFDQMVEVSRWGAVEVSGHAYRGTYDLHRHAVYSGQDLRAFEPYPNPKKVKVVEVVPDRERIKEVFGDKAEYIIRAIMLQKGEEVLKELREKGFIEVLETKVDKDLIKIVELEKTVSGNRFIPHVVEPSFGAERLVYVTLEHSYSVKGDRVVMRIPRDIAPISVAVFPLVSRDGIPEKAREIYESLKKVPLYVIYDESGSIGRRYARADEIGVPIAITVDYQTLKDNTVTLRNRDTWEQVRVHVDKVTKAVVDYIEKRVEFNELASY